MSGQQYRTRYGIMTAEGAAEDMLDSACTRLELIQGLLTANDSENLTLPGRSAEGLARILADIAYDVMEARFYHVAIANNYRADREPGKIGEAPEVRS